MGWIRTSEHRYNFMNIFNPQMAKSKMLIDRVTTPYINTWEMRATG